MNIKEIYELYAKSCSKWCGKEINSQILGKFALKMKDSKQSFNVYYPFLIQ